MKYNKTRPGLVLLLSSEDLPPEHEEGGMYFANISDAKASLSRLVEMVVQGEDVVIGKAGKPVARLVPFAGDSRVRAGGQWKGRVKVAADFDDLPDDIARSFKGESQ